MFEATLKKLVSWGFPGSPVFRAQRFLCYGPGFDPCRGPKFPQAMWRSQKFKNKTKKEKS